MVKNTLGGNKAKGMARKDTKSSSSRMLQISTDENEKYACVTRIFGGPRCEVYIDEKTTLIGNIRGKMTGRQKKNNLIVPPCIVLVGLHDWESVPKNCDILCLYDDSEISKLKTMPSVDISHLIKKRESLARGDTDSTSVTSSSLELEFTNSIAHEQVAPSLLQAHDFKLEEEEEVDIDDI